MNIRRNTFTLFLCALACAATAEVSRIESTPNAPFELSLDVDVDNPTPMAQIGYVEYSNTAKWDIPAPYVRIETENGTEVRFGGSDEWGDNLEFMAVSETAPASHLKPGETRKISFEYRSLGKAVDMQFGFSTGNEKPFPWEANSPRMRPSWADDMIWGLCLSTLRANIGATWNDYLARMRSDIDHFSRLGETAYRLDHLWQLEVNEAFGGDLAVPALDESTDMIRPARGFGLAFTRTYGSATYSRLLKGTLGYGWSDNYAAWAELTDGGRTLAFHGGSRETYLFHRVGRVWVPEKGRAKTVLSETDEEYALAFEGGLQMRIGKSVMRTTLIKDNQGNELRFSYDSDGQLVRVEHVDGQFLTFSYRDGLLTSVSDDLGRSSSYEYNGGMLVASTSIDGQRTQYRYLPADNTVCSRALRQIVLPDGNTQDFTYDSKGRLATLAVNGGTKVTEIRRSRLGSYTIVAPNGAETSVRIGSKGVPLRAVNAVGQKVAIQYRDDGLVSSVVGSTGRKSEMEYDSEGRPVAVKDPLGTTTRFGYDKEGRVDSVTDARGNAYRFGYDARGRGETVAFAGGPATRIEYSDRGDVTRFVNARGESVFMTYDKVGRPLTKTWESGRKFSWTYDARGNCVRSEDSETGAVTMKYDNLDRLVRIEHPGNRGFAYEYDSLGRIVRKTSLADGREQRYEFNKLGALAKVTDEKGELILENEYDAETGDIVRQRNGNGTYTTFENDLLGRATRIEHFGPDGKSIGFFAYEYDEDGNRVSQTTAEGVERYEYDANDQLVGVTYPDGTRETFAYDAVGNRLSANGVKYETNERNQVVKTVGADGAETCYDYDADGNLVRKTDAGGAVTEYAYDIENRLVSVRSAAQDIDWSCAYDVLGNRIKVTDHGKTTERLYANEGIPSVEAEYVDGALTARHVLLAGLALADVGADGAVRWRHADTLSSTRIVTDGAGKVTGTAGYKAFGELRASEGDAPASGWLGGLGVENDPTGLLFMRHRNYDPGLGRFIQQDPIGLSGGQINLYVYCGNSPVMNVDFLGLFPWSYFACYSLRAAHTIANNLGILTGIVGIGLGIAAIFCAAPWIATATAIVGAIGLGAAIAALGTNFFYRVFFDKKNLTWKAFAADVINLVLAKWGGSIFKSLGKIKVPQLRAFFKWLGNASNGKIGMPSKEFFKIAKKIINSEGFRNAINNLVQTILSALPSDMDVPLLH